MLNTARDLGAMRAAPRRPMLAAALAVGALASPGSPPLSDLSWPCAHNKGADETAVPHGALANGGDSVPATMLPLTAGGAACLDGSPYGFYFVPSASSSKWTISFEGGGWCYNETYCAE